MTSKAKSFSKSRAPKRHLKSSSSLPKKKTKHLNPNPPVKKPELNVGLEPDVSDESDEENILYDLRKSLGVRDLCSDESEYDSEELENTKTIESNTVEEDEIFSDIELSNPKNEQLTMPATTLGGSNEVIINTEETEADDKINKKADPFSKHFLCELHPNLEKCIGVSGSKGNKQIECWPLLKNLTIEIPQSSNIEVSTTSKCILEDDVNYTLGGVVPIRLNLNSPIEELYIKPQILKTLLKDAGNYTIKSLFSPLQHELFTIINNYQDLCYTGRTEENANDIQFLYSLHILNHILKTRSIILRNNDKLSSRAGESDNDKYRDQGLVRPKVLVIVPFKHSAYKIVSQLENMLFSVHKGNVINKKKFVEQFTGNELVLPIINQKPEDFQSTFVGNIGDDFKIGISITKKSLKLFVDFYLADIIIASPLGLRRVIGAPGEKERNYDFLASIEVLVLDQTEIFMMQNWDHVIHILDHLHILPKESHETDFSRVRLWSLNGKAKFYRQTLLFSSVNLPEILSLFNKKCANYAGRVKASNHCQIGSISKVIGDVAHRFYKFQADNPQNASDKRFDFFLEKILPQFIENQMRQTVIFIPNYFDFVRLRNHFKKEMLSFTQICEYTSSNKVARSRDILFNRDIHFMLYTERFHFYHRIKLRGICHLIFYQPPNFPHFYSELCNFMHKENLIKSKRKDTNFSVSVIYSKYDVNQLSEIVGSDKAMSLMKSKRECHTLLTG